jgi:hypothetical protein
LGHIGGFACAGLSVELPEARAWLIRALLLLQRQQATEQSAAFTELLRIKIAVEQTHQPAPLIFRDASVAAR